MNDPIDYSLIRPVGPLAKIGVDSTVEKQEQSQANPTLEECVAQQIATATAPLFGKPKGLRLMEQPPMQLPASFAKGGNIGGHYTYERDKQFGVEPGFEAYKSWKTSDDQKLNQPSHHFFIQANQLILEKLKNDAEFQKVKAEIESAYPSINAQDLLDALRNHPQLKPIVQAHLKANNQKFQKKHFVKLNYDQPDAKGKVRIPFYRAKAPAIFGPLGKLIHQASTAATPREKNFGAVTEALANDLFTALDFGGQKLKLVKAQYPDGSIKLLLDGTEVRGEKGEKFATLDGQIKAGYLDGNCVVGQDGTRYPFDEKQLGQSKIKALLMGDRDKVGSKGFNIGFVVIDGKARLKNIDPGKSLDIPQKLTQDRRPRPQDYTSFARYWLASVFFDILFFFTGSTNLMTFDNLHTDLSFDQPLASIKDTARGGYHNYSIFDDTKLSDKMAGMRTILEKWDEIENIFDAYIAEFSQEGDLNFNQELQQMKQMLTERKMQFENKLEERLALTDEQLDFVDNLEKLTSTTRHKVGKIQFRHLQVVQDSRIEWHLTKIGTGYELSCHSDDPQRIVEKLQNYRPKNIEAPLDLTIKVNHEQGRLSIAIKDDQLLQKAMQAFSESNIAAYKKQPLRDDLVVAK